MNINIKLVHPKALVPVKGHETDACFDLAAATFVNPITYDYIEYDTGVAFEIPHGYCGLVYPRSSISNKGLYLANSVGVIDSSYRGTIKVRFYAADKEGFHLYDVGDRIAQIMFVPVKAVTLDVVQDLSTTKRQDGGFGSTGQK